MFIRVEVSFLLDTFPIRKVLFLSWLLPTASLTNESIVACLLTYLATEVLVAAFAESQFLEYLVFLRLWAALRKVSNDSF
jgi:hypothetical protein